MQQGYVLTKKQRGHAKKNNNDWYECKSYPHFDEPIFNRKEALNVVYRYRNGASYGFYPLIQFDIKQSRYRTKRQENNNKIKVIDKEKSRPKIRTINYPSHKDGYIFSYYAHELSKLYEKKIESLSLGECVSAYRKNIGSNIDIAGQVFKFIKETKNCICLAYDITKFFDSLDHNLLKKQILKILNASKLPTDYYKIYKAVTCYSAIRLDDLPKNEQGLLNKPVCSPKQLRELKDKIYIHKESYGIPQGTQISALLSNIYMLDFDIQIKDFIYDMNGIYKRYADDIIIVVPIVDDIKALFESIEEKIKETLKTFAGNLKINDGKTEKVIFSDGKVKITPYSKLSFLQYLGLIYNGTKILVRSNSVSRYMRKMLGGVRRKICLAKNSSKNKGVVFKTYLYYQYSHLGTQNFYNYTRNIHRKLSPTFSSELMVKHQLRKHMNILNKEIRGIRTTKHHRK